MVRMLAQRLLGSPDIFGHRQREPEQSLNFVTCHDGFTLNDLVSYNAKHNEANGEGNRDGSDNNLSWNCGVEGPSEDEAVERLRRRQVKNFIVMLLTSLGTPMLMMGDEMRRTQHGNNNAYCQDSEIGWLDWSLLDRHRDLHRFVQTLIAHRLRWMEVRGAERFGMTLNEVLRRGEIDWHGVRLGCPDWSDDSHSIAFTVRPGSDDFPFRLHVMINAYWETLDFELPPVPQTAVSGWRRWIDTALEAPEDIVDPPAAPLAPAARYGVAPRSIAALLVRIGASAAPACEAKQGVAANSTIA
jgi:glycogen operon protein